MPLLNDLSKRYKDAGFTLLSINTEASQKDADSFLKHTPVDFTVLYDSNKTVSDTYGVDAMPTSIFIDCDGNLNYLHRGYESGDMSAYKKRVKKLLASCQ